MYFIFILFLIGQDPPGGSGRTNGTDRGSRPGKSILFHQKAKLVLNRSSIKPEYWFNSIISVNLLGYTPEQ